MMNLGKRGEELIKSYETLRLEAYLPTPDDKLTIGWGHTKGVYKGMQINLENAQEFFLSDVKDSVDAVNKLPCKLTQSMFDALVSLVFNAGSKCISERSTIGDALRMIPGAKGLRVNICYYAAWRGFSLWTKQAGKDLLGLARRRSEEMTLFLADGLPK